MSAVQRQRLAPWALFVLLGSYFSLRAAPSLTWYDSGELAAAAFSLGLSHPPGQPLYQLLGHAASLLPVGDIAFRMNLLSAWSAAAMLAALLPLARALFGPGGATVGAVAALGAAAAPPVLEQATRAEVYAPAAATAMWAAVSVVGYANQEWGERKRHGALMWLGPLALAATAALHAIAALAMALPLALVGIRYSPAGTRLRRMAIAVAVVVAATFLWLTYVPVAATRHSGFQFVSLRAPSELVDYLRASAYGHNVLEPIGLAKLVAALRARPSPLWDATSHAFVALGLLGMLGWVVRCKGGLALLATLALTLASTFYEVRFHPANPDKRGYLLMGYALLALGAAASILSFGRWLMGERPRMVGSTVGSLAAAGLGGLAVAALASGYGRHLGKGANGDGEGPGRLAAAALHPLAAGRSVALMGSDHLIFPAVYAQVVEGERPDVVAAAPGLMTQSSYLRALKRTAPELFVPYLDDGGQRSGIVARFVRENLPRAHVYVEELRTAGLDPRWQLTPRGPLFAVQPKPRTDNESAPPPPRSVDQWLSLAQRGLLPDDALPGDPGRRVAGRVRYDHLRWLLAQADRRSRAAALTLMGYPTRDAGHAPIAQDLPDSPLRPLSLERIGPEPGTWIFDPRQQQLLAADLFWSLGDGTTSARILDPLVLDHMTSALLLRARHCLLEGDLPTVDRLLQDGREYLDPVEARYLIGYTLLEQGRPELATLYFEAILRIKPNEERAALLLANYDEKAGKVESAIRRLRRLLVRRPGSVAAWKGLAVLYGRDGRIGEAKEATNQALKLAPGRPDLLAIAQQLTLE
jgi:tetratricopeptide (TPR) repeat protein